MMRLVALDDGRTEAYARFLAGRDDALLYHSLPYRDLLVEHLGARAEYLLAVNGAGEVAGALPTMWLDTDAGSVLNSLPYYGSHGSVLADDDEARSLLLAAWGERARDPGTLSATLVTNPFSQRAIDPPAHNLTDSRISQVTTLPEGGTAPRERVMAMIDGSARRNVQKAGREGAEVDRDASAMDTLRAIHESNIAALGGQAKSPEFFHAVGRHFARGQEYEVWVARMDGEVAAGLLVFYFNGTVEYFTPAVAHEHRSRQPLAAVLAEALADAVQRGFRRWNWGGTWDAQSGVFRFKRKWGAGDARYQYFIQLNDDSLRAHAPTELRARFGHFYVLPFSSIEPKGEQ
jgi:hypothetical protein